MHFQSKSIALPFNRQLNWLYKAVIFVKVSTIFNLLTALQVTAQIVPDNTLPNNSIVRTSGNTDVIEGGSQAGSNLFHSYEQFSIPTGGTAYFNNSADIQNIFSRVTGGSISNIDGTLRANGTANLFLLNPNGIIFGPNAKLDIGGSFLGTTASSVNFADGLQFTASPPQSVPLLTVSVPVGLGFGSNSGNIQVQGNGQGIRSTTDLIDTSSGLRVQPNQTLALLGGNVALQGATLKTAGGRIELGSVAGPGLVSLTPINKGYALGYLGVSSFNDLTLSGQTSVDASGDPGGDIQLAGRQISIASGSQVENSVLGAAPGGSLSVAASKSLEVVGGASSSVLSSLGGSVYPGTTGNGGNINIETGSLSVRDGGQVGSATFGAGSAGNLSIKAKDSVELIGAFPNSDYVSGLFTASQRGSTGNSGNIALETGHLSIRDGATITTSAFSIGSPGSAGSVSIKAKDGVELTGVSPGDRTPSAIVTSTNRGTTGNGGNINIETGKLSVRDGGQVGSATYGAGSAGNLSIKAKDSVELVGAFGQAPSSIIAASQPGSTGNGGSVALETERLSIRDGAVLGVGTIGSGSAGSLSVKARDAVELAGTTIDGRPSRLSVRTAATGNAGDLVIETERLTVRDGASVTATSEGSGRAGQMRIRANSIYLNNRGKLEAETSPGEGGNIFLNSQNLQLRNGSTISATAGLAGGGGNGGNVIIDTDSLAAVNRSSITANAFTGRGGNIQITTQGIFQSPDSIFDASSQFGVDGTVEVRSLGLEPDEALVPYNKVFIPMEEIVKNSCFARRNKKQARLVITGNGGFPAGPGDSVMPMPLFSAEGLEAQSPPPSSPAPADSGWQEGDPVVEATGIIKTKDGRTLLGMVGSSLPNAEEAICRQD